MFSVVARQQRVLGYTRSGNVLGQGRKRNRGAQRRGLERQTSLAKKKDPVNTPLFQCRGRRWRKTPSTAATRNASGLGLVEGISRSLAHPSARSRRRRGRHRQEPRWCFAHHWRWWNGLFSSTPIVEVADTRTVRNRVSLRQTGRRPLARRRGTA